MVLKRARKEIKNELSFTIRVAYNYLENESLHYCIALFCNICYSLQELQRN